MSGAVKKYIVVCDGFETVFSEFADSPEEAVKNTGFDLEDSDFTYYIVEVTKTWEIKTSPRIVEEDNALFFLGKNIPQSKPKIIRKVK
jgi:hypothetical protein